MTDGDRAVLCVRVSLALQRHEHGHSAHGIRVAFTAGAMASSLLADRGPGGASVKSSLESVFNESLIERERAAARTLLAIMRHELDVSARLARLEAL